MTITPIIAACLFPAVPAELEKVDRTEWSKPVNGVRGRFFSVKDEYKPGEDLQFVFIFQNLTEKPVPLPGFRVDELVLPRDHKGPRQAADDNLRIILDEDTRDRIKVAQISGRIQEAREDLQPGGLRILVVTVRQGFELEEAKERLRRIGEPDRAKTTLVTKLSPGKHRFRAVFTPLGLPVPEGVEQLERLHPKRDLIWEGKTIVPPPVEVLISEPADR